MAEWDWDNPDNNNASAERHAPDRNNYHVPGDDVLSKIRPSKVGRFATIPEAGRNGASKGFNVNDPTLVHVDPHAPDGGVLFDPHAMNKQILAQTVSRCNYPHQVYYALGTEPPRRGYDMRGYEKRENPVRPNDYVVPGSDTIGQQIKEGYYPVQEERQVPAVPAQPPQPVYQPQLTPQPMPGQPQPQQQQQPIVMPPQPQWPPPAYYPPQPQQDPQTAMILGQIMQGMQAISQAVTAQNQQRLPPTTGVSAVPMPVGPPPQLATIPVEHRRRGQDADEDLSARPIRTKRKRDEDEEPEDDRPARRTRGMIEEDRRTRQTVRDYDEEQAANDPRDGVITGFETLGIKWLAGPVPLKPKVRTVLDMGANIGKIQTYYHDVIDSESNVALIYDTRYEEGQQYLPPMLNTKPIMLHVPSLKMKIPVCSMGFTFSFGVFDVVLLVKPTEEAPDEAYPEEE